jgi:hypothetical protein
VIGSQSTQYGSCLLACLRAAMEMFLILGALFGNGHSAAFLGVLCIYRTSCVYL